MGDRRFGDRRSPLAASIYHFCRKRPPDRLASFDEGSLMTQPRFGLVVRTAALLACAIALPLSGRATTLDESAPPGGNYDKAEFRFWYPDDAAPLRALVILVPGSNGDGRAQVDEPVWREFATRLHLGLVGCRFTDKQHDQMFIEHYVDVSKGTGPALLNALTAFAVARALGLDIPERPDFRSATITSPRSR